MAKRRLRLEPYNPDAFDADGDGIVQEWTPWERPAGTFIIDETGQRIKRGANATERGNFRVVDRNNKPVDYTPTYSVEGTGTPQRSVLGRTLGERSRTIGAVQALRDRLGTLNTGAPIVVSPGVLPPQSAPERSFVDKVIGQRYDGFSKSFKEATERRLKNLGGVTKRKIRNRTLKALESATPEMFEKALTWYPRVNSLVRTLVSRIEEQHGTKIDFEIAAAVVAALSPGEEFKKNARGARRIMTVFAEDKEVELDPKLIKGLKMPKKQAQEILKRFPNGRAKLSDFTDDELPFIIPIHPDLQKISNQTGMKNIYRAFLMLRASGRDSSTGQKKIEKNIEIIDDLLGGPKVRSFFNNIVDPDGPHVTMDTWMYRLMFPSNVKFNFRGRDDTLDGHRKFFKARIDDYKEKAKALRAELQELEVNGKKLSSDEIEERIINTLGKQPQALKIQDIFQSRPSSKEYGDNIGLYPWFATIVQEIADEMGVPPAALQAVLWEIARTTAGYEPTIWQGVEDAFLGN